MTTVYINSSPTKTGAVTQPAPLSITSTRIDLDALDLTGLADGTIYIAVETGTGKISNWVSATKITLQGTGVLLAQDVTTPGSLGLALTPIEGSGVLDSDDSTLSGFGSVNPAPKVVTGTGTLLSQEAVSSGTADNAIYQIGARTLLNVQSATASGAGTRNATLFDAPALAAQAVTLSGAAVVQQAKEGSGALVAQDGAITGTGNITKIVTGDGTLVVDVATTIGSGFKTILNEGSGVLLAQDATTQGAAAIGKEISGNGSLDAQDATTTSTGVVFPPSVTITTPVASVGAYDQGTQYVVSVPFSIDSIQFTWSSDDPEYLSGNLSVEIALVDGQGRLPLASMNINTEPSVLFYDTQGADTSDRFARIKQAIENGGATIEISGYDDLATSVAPFAQDGGLMVHNLDLAA